MMKMALGLWKSHLKLTFYRMKHEYNIARWNLNYKFLFG
jgi:hypothetical protein